jgi:hypothetical protein
VGLAVQCYKTAQMQGRGLPGLKVVLVLLGLLLPPLALDAVGQPPPAAPPAPADPSAELEPEPDRWRLLEPLGTGVKARNPLYDPYNPNVLKGDYPLVGDKLFGSITAVLDAVADFKRNLDFFTTGRIRNVPYHEHNVLGQLTGTLALELFRGDTVFQPQDWRIRVTPIVRFRCGDKNAIDQGCGEDVRMFEAFGDVKLFEIGETFDATTARLGLQVFNADFFGFVFNDVQPGARVFSELARNQFKVNVAGFDRLNKEKLTGLNEFKRRENQTFVGTFQWDDFVAPGFNALFSFVANFDDRPAGGVEAYYLGVAATGRLGRVNVNGTGYYVFGETARNTPTRRPQDISAWMAFGQVAYPISFVTPRLAVVYASGDGDVRDRRARGFDAVFDNVAFGGGQFSYLFGEKIQLGDTVLLRGNSVFPSLRAANATSQFVNPGLLAVNIGTDVSVTPALAAEVNVNYVRFDRTASLEALVRRRHVANEVGTEVNGGVAYRPFYNENVIIFVGAGVLAPGQGLRDTFGGDDPVYKLFLRTLLTF